MSTVHGVKADVFGNGYILSTFLNSYQNNGTKDLAEVTTFKAQSKSYVVGMNDGNVSLAGIWDGAVGAIDDVLYQAFGQSSNGLFSYVPQGADTIGNPAFNIDCIESQYQVNSAVGGVSQISAQLQVGTAGRFDRGRISHPYQAEAAGGNTASLNSPTGAATTNGGSLIVHATAASSLVVKLQDSADNTTFADITASTLTMGSTANSQRALFTGTIRQYTRCLWTGTGTFVAIIVRN